MNVADQTVEDMVAQLYKDEETIKQLTEELAKYKKGYEASIRIVKSIFPEKFPGTYFITGEAGEKDTNDLPETLLICPAYGVDWFQLYKRTDETYGPEY